MSTQTTTQPSLEVLHDNQPSERLIEKLSNLAIYAGRPNMPEHCIVALSELVQDKPFNEDEPHFALKVDIIEAFANLRAGKPVDQEHLVLAGLGYIVGTRSNEDVPNLLEARAKAMANLILSHEAGVQVDLATALPRVVGISEINYA